MVFDSEIFVQIWAACVVEQVVTVLAVLQVFPNCCYVPPANPFGCTNLRVKQRR